MRYFAHNIGDYAAATAHLSFIEDAAYHRLLRRYYQDEKPLPSDVGECQRLVGARSRAERDAVVATLREFFILTTDGWTQSRADREIALFNKKVEAARTNGTKGGRPANPRKTNQVPEQNQEQKLPNPQSHNSVPNGTDAGDAASVVFRQGLAWLMKATGKPEGVCRAQLGKWRKDIGDEALIAALGVGQREMPIDAMAFMEKAVATRKTGPARKPWEKPQTDGLPTEEPWEARMKGWLEKRFWVASSWGPPPGEYGCRVPAIYRSAV